MYKILTYSVLLCIGLVISQVFDLTDYRILLSTVTMTCLAYIMIEVGLEFKIDKRRLDSYANDYLIAMTAATFPWILCAVYFIWMFEMSPREAFLLGRFAAPTSAGILFTMLAAAGLATTWLFRKARILAIFDDLDTILLLIPLRMMFVGFDTRFLLLLATILFTLLMVYRYLHQFKAPTGSKWLLIYGFFVVIACELINHGIEIELEILFPAFALGCLLYNPLEKKKQDGPKHFHEYIEPQEASSQHLDMGIKATFSFLVGCSLPHIHLEQISFLEMFGHVAIITVLSNLGKMFPTFCYKKEATFRERIALSVAMFPRGEVGAGVLLLAMRMGITGLPLSVAVLSLALNLLLTGFFITFVIWLIRPKKVSF